jgi:RNA polymerase sigma-70 factor (ECF subfamily)
MRTGTPESQPRRLHAMERKPRLLSYRAMERTDASDIVTSLARAIGRMDHREPGTNVGSWIVQIIRSIFLTEVRRRRRNREWQRIVRPEEPSPAPPDLNIYLPHLREVFERMPLIHREVLVLLGLEALTYSQTAAALGIPIGTVRSRISRARYHLKKKLKRLDEERALLPPSHQ